MFISQRALAIQANTYGGMYAENIKGLQQDYEKMWGPLSDPLRKLAEVVAL